MSAAWTTESSSAHWRGQTLGKRILQLRVIDADGLRLTASPLVVRNLLRSVELPAAFDEPYVRVTIGYRSGPRAAASPRPSTRP